MTDTGLFGVTETTEKQTAERLKRELQIALERVAGLMDEAGERGFILTWEAIRPTPPTNKNQVVGLKVIRIY